MFKNSTYLLCHSVCGEDIVYVGIRVNVLEQKKRKLGLFL